MGALRVEGEAPPPQTFRFGCYFPEVYKMTKVREDGIENWKKSIFPLRFLYVNFKIFSTNFNPQWFLAQTRKDLPLGFLNSFRIIKDLH